HRHFHHLFRQHGTSPAGGDRPPHFDQIKDGGRGIAGSPATVMRMIKAQTEEAGANYFVAQFAFGDLTRAEALRTVDLFAREVMPRRARGCRTPPQPPPPAQPQARHFYPAMHPWRRAQENNGINGLCQETGRLRIFYRAARYSVAAVRCKVTLQV